MSDAFFAILYIIAFSVVFVLFWAGIVFLISRLSGWSNLAKEFPAPEDVDGRVFNWCSARLRMFVNYSNCLTVIVSSAGIYLEPMIFFRIGHKPILIPGYAIMELSRGSSIFFTTTKLAIRTHTREEPVTIILYGRRLAEALEEENF